MEVSNSLKRNVDFSILRYANCWEDAGVLLQTLNVQPQDRILIIASGGDNALALLSAGPQSVRAIDLSRPQFYLCELKQQAFAKLDRDEVLCLLGAKHCEETQRWKLYQSLRVHLGNSAKSYWDARRTEIEAGIIHGGKFERYFHLFRRWLLPLAHNRTTTEDLLRPKSDEEQAAFFAQRWNSWRWRTLMAVFFSKAVMGRYGRDPQFLKHVSLNVPAYIRSKAEAHLQTSAATLNPFLRYIFTGSFGDSLPLYLQEANFAAIKQHIGRLHIAEEDMDTAVRQAQYDIYCASNIFEYMSANTFRDTAQSWTGMIGQGARLAFWNLMAPRSFAETLPESWAGCGTAPLCDNGFFYSRYLLERRL